MIAVTLSATPRGNGYASAVAYPDGVTMSSAETYPTVSEALGAAAVKLLGMPERLERLDAGPTDPDPSR